MTRLRQQLSAGLCAGIFSKTLDSAFVEAAGLAGLDFIILDSEHGPASLQTLHQHVRAARAGGIAALVRVPGLEPSGIASALDTGADGVQVPNISTADQARAAVDAARFHPVGQRGLCRFVRAASFGSVPAEEYFREANEALLVLQVEGRQGVENLDEILAVPGFDVLFVGPYDLSQSMGRPGEVSAPEVLELIAQIAAKARARGVHLGVFCDSQDNARRFRDNGFRYLSYSVDVNIFLEACRQLGTTLRG